MLFKKENQLKSAISVVGGNSSETVGDTKSINVGKKFEIKVGTSSFSLDNKGNVDINCEELILKGAKQIIANGKVIEINGGKVKAKEADSGDDKKNNAKEEKADDETDDQINDQADDKKDEQLEVATTAAVVGGAAVVSDQSDKKDDDKKEEKDKPILKKDYLSKNETLERIAIGKETKSYSKGSKDLEEIGLIQKALKELKFDIKVDKDFGIKTKKIIETFQESYKPTHKTHKDYTLGKKGDGIVGRNTLLALDEACVEGWEYEVEEKYYTIKEGVKLALNIENKIAKIAKKYYKATKEKIVVTSATRNSKTQASAMFKKLVNKNNLKKLYTNQIAVEEIIQAYNKGVNHYKSTSEIISDIKIIIDKQISKNIYISKHLIKGAVDIRSKNMTSSQRIIFKNCAKDEAKNILLESDHLHLSF